jgi:DNA-binding LacI/PurR family transcriptional regulator
MVTMHDVARAAGVSPMTVSNVINERPYVSDETKGRVLLAIEQLGYRVNVAARNLRAGRTGTIGLSVPELDRPYFGELAARISRAASEQGFRVAVEQTGATREQELAALAESKNRMFDGLILSTVALGPEDADLLRVDYPVVILGERIFAGPADHIAMPNIDGAEAATRHLLSLGCTRIGMLGGPYSADGLDVGSLRREGYRRALEAAGFEGGAVLSQALPEYSLASGARGAVELLSAHPNLDGLFCITDTVALGALRALRDAGRDVPRDIKVIGFDALELGEYTNPRLSSVDPGHDYMARTAVDMLIERIEEPDRERAPREIVSSFLLRERESTIG